jgi:hypothetical protein
LEKKDFVKGYLIEKTLETSSLAFSARVVDYESGYVLQFPYFSIRLFWDQKQRMFMEMWLPFTHYKYRHEIKSLDQILRIASSQLPQVAREWKKEFEIRESEEETADFGGDGEQVTELELELLNWLVDFNNDTSGAPKEFWFDWLTNSPPLQDPEDWDLETDFLGFGLRLASAEDEKELSITQQEKRDKKLKKLRKKERRALSEMHDSYFDV